MQLKSKIILSLSLLFFVVNVHAEQVKTSYWQSFLNHFREGFYFEKYDGVEATKELLRLYPVGSDAYRVVDTLEKAGASCRIETLTTLYEQGVFEGKEFTQKVKKYVKTDKQYITNEKDLFWCSYMGDRLYGILKWHVYTHVYLKDGKVFVKEIGVNYQPWWGK